MSATPRKVSLRSFELIDEPILNKGSGIPEDDRSLFGVNVLLPPAVEIIESRVQRVHAAYKNRDMDIERHIFLRALQDMNDTLFDRLMIDHVVEMPPLVYTPVVGLARPTFSENYRRPPGLFIS
jgi:malate dehydrogenase (oxaloacetate-decarboxylating)